MLLFAWIDIMAAIDEETKSVAASEAPKEAVPAPKPAPEEIIVHPIVLLSVVDHYNRVAKDTRKRVVGVLLGETSQGIHWQKAASCETLNHADSFCRQMRCDHKLCRAFRGRPERSQYLVSGSQLLGGNGSYVPQGELYVNGAGVESETPPSATTPGYGWQISADKAGSCRSTPDWFCYLVYILYSVSQPESE